MISDRTDTTDPADPRRVRGVGSVGGKRLRRWTGAVPVTAAVLVVGAAAALTVPPVRDALANSFQRQPAPYVELYFADESAARSCPATDGQFRVVAAVRSHLSDDEDLPYVVRVIGADGADTARTAGVVAASPGRAADFGARVPVPEADYTVRVELAGRPEYLQLHCAGGSS